MRSYLKENPLQKRAGEVAQGIGPEFKPQYQKTKQNKTKKPHFDPNFRFVAQTGILYLVILLTYTAN
jgi:hypothetical protein